MQRCKDTEIAVTEELVRRLESASAEQLSWLKRAHCALLFGEEPAVPPPPRAPAPAEGASETDCADFARLHARHAEMEAAARTLFGAPAIEKRAYEAFMGQVELFCREQRQVEFRLRHRLAETDPLTGIRNRRSMMAELRREWTRSMRTGEPCCIALLDLDHFKQINDTFGHQAGDSVLRVAAQFIRKRIRSYDLLYRYGGEEFLLCLPATDVDTAYRLLDRLRTQLARQSARLVDGRRIAATVSIGIAAMRPDSAVEAAIADADHAVYEAKEKGRDRVCVNDPDMEPISRPAWRGEGLRAGRG
jgi:diguanylate cyclase (GGDEF)-like protein